jgi:ribosomal protein L11 methyltransferase
VTVEADAAEAARARMLDLFPEGFEEVVRDDAVELAAYSDADGEQRLRAAFVAAVSEPVADDWADRWRSFHRPVRIGPLWVGPPWEAPPRDAAAVVIDPGRAFGTGAHPTTRLSVELLLQLDRGALLDLGCGSGVLAIAAVRLGFAPVVAMDDDPAAVEATRSNASANGVAVEARVADVLAEELPTTDVAVANVSLAVVEAVAQRLTAEWLVTSGYLVSDRPRLDGYEHRERVELDGWAADLHRLRRK